MARNESPFPRLRAARREVWRLQQRLGQTRVQRNMLQQQRDRALAALDTINQAHALAEVRPRLALDPNLLADAIAQGAALQRVADEYDRLQTMTDPDYAREG